MKKLAFHYELSEEQKKQKDFLVTTLLKDPYIIKFMETFNVDEHFIYDHSGKLDDYCSILNKCQNCKGIKFCPQPVKGYFLNFTVDDILVQTLKPCAFTLVEQEMYSHMKYYTYFDLSKSYGTIDLNEIKLLDESIDYANAFKKAVMVLKGESEKGLYLCGKPGVGKTYLACGISNGFAKNKTKVGFLNLPNWIAELKRNMQDNASFDRMIKITQNALVLVVDDIGGESVTAWSRDDILLPLLEARMKEGKLTIFTSNYRLNELKERYALNYQKGSEPIAAERIIERIRTLSEEIFVKGDSRRK